MFSHGFWTPAGSRILEMESESAVDGTSLDLGPVKAELSRRVSSSLNFSTSPHPSSWPKSGDFARAQTFVSPKPLKPFNTADFKILLLENVNKTGVDLLQGVNYQVTSLKSSLPEDELIEKIRCGTLVRFILCLEIANCTTTATFKLLASAPRQSSPRGCSRLPKT